MKILIITDAWHPQVNGVVRTYENLSNELISAGHEVTIISPLDFPNTMPMPGYKEINLTIRPYKKIKMLMDSQEFDTIHIATEGPLGWAARKYCLRRNLKFTTSYHTQFPEYLARRVRKYCPPLYKTVHKAGVRFIRKFHAPASALLVTTDTMSVQLKEWEIKTPIYPFTKGVNNDVFKLGDKTLFEELKKPISLYVGRLAIEKNIEDFLKMEWSGSKVVVGHGPDENTLRKKYKDVVFTGKKSGEELAQHYQSSDVFVFPSTTDTFGIVLIEALSCGLPIAAYDVIGPRDVVTSNDLGCLNDNLTLAAESALENGSAEIRSTHVKQNYSWKKAMENFLSASKV